MSSRHVAHTRSARSFGSRDSAAGRCGASTRATCLRDVLGVQIVLDLEAHRARELLRALADEQVMVGDVHDQLRDLRRRADAFDSRRRRRRASSVRACSTRRAARRRPRSAGRRSRRSSSVGSSSTMLTPATRASSTSAPLVIIANAVSTQVFAPPFLNLLPLLEDDDDRLDALRRHHRRRLSEERDGARRRRARRCGRGLNELAGGSASVSSCPSCPSRRVPAYTLASTLAAMIIRCASDVP